MLVRSALALWILGTVVVEISGFPASVPPESQYRQQPDLEKRENTPFSFKVDWNLVENELQSLLDDFISKKTSTSSSSGSTKLVQPSTTLSAASMTPHSDPPSTVSSSSSTRSSSSSSHPSSPSPSASHSPSSSSSSSSPRSSSFSPPPTSSPLPASSSRSFSFSSPTPHPSTVSSSQPSLSPSPKPVSSSSDSNTTSKTTTTFTTTSTFKTTTTTTTTASTTTISAVPTRTGTPSIQPPYFVVYTDESAFGFPTSEEIKGFNIVILSFFLANSEAADQAAAWAQLSSTKRDSIRADYRANNISLMISALGSTEAPTTEKIDPVQYANDVAAWAIKFDMDGVDVDYEDFEAVGAGTALEWLVTFTTTLRTALPDHMILTHAPVAPWLTAEEVYFELEQKVGAAIDFYNVQFYSQGVLYTTCDGLLSTSGGVFPNSSLFELINGGIPPEKLVIGKPGTLADVGVSVDLLGIVSVGADPVVHSPDTTSHSKRDSITNTNGFMDPDLLAKCLVHAVSQNWKTGVMAWEYPDANSTWIQTARSLAFPLN